MGQIRKVGDIYYIEFYARGLMYSQVAGPDPIAAQKLLEAIEAKIAGGEALTVVREIDLPVFFEQFFIYGRSEFGPKSSQRFLDLTLHFQNFLNAQYPAITKLSQVTPNLFEGYKAFLAAHQKPAMVNFSILLLREMMEYGIKLDFINDNPTLHVRLLPMSLKRRAKTRRYQLAGELLRKAVPMGKVFKALQLSDIAKMMYFAHLIPLSSEELK